MDRKLISVVVPSYNHSKYIRSVLDSIVNQNYSPIEIVIVDDGSTDDSVEVIKAYVAEHENDPGRTFQTYFRKNHGAHRSINFGIERSRGSVVTILNSDDLFHPDRLRLLSKPIFEGKTELTMSLCEFIDGKGDVMPATSKQCTWITSKIEIRHLMPSLSLTLLLLPLQITSGNLVFTRRLFDRLAGFRDYQWCHDYDFTMRATLLTEPVLVSRKLMSYRYHATNTVTSIEREKARFRQELRRILEDYIEDGAIAYDEKTLANRFAATPFTWPEKFRQVTTRQVSVFSDRTFQQELCFLGAAVRGHKLSPKADIEVSPNLWPYLNSEQEATQALQAYPQLLDLPAENLRHEFVPSMKPFKGPSLHTIRFQSQAIGTMIETSTNIESDYNSHLLLAGLFDDNRLVAVLRQTKSRGSEQQFRGFSTLSREAMEKRDLKICWLDFDGKKMKCRWPGRKSPLKASAKLTKKVLATGFIDSVYRAPGNTAVEGWAVIDGKLPEKIEMTCAGIKVPVTPILRPRPDLANFLQNSRDQVYAGFRFVMLGDDCDYFRPNFEIIAHYGGKSLHLRKQEKLISKKI